jgi:hypothetical protein
MAAAPKLLTLLLALSLRLGIPLATADGDVDDDSWVTRADARTVMSCLRDGGVQTPGCEAADVDRDGDVDLRDAFIVRRQRGLRVCNGSPVLCERSYDTVAYATTHNAFATIDAYFPASNQSLPLSVQLQDGVRGLMLDTWYHDRDRDGTSDGVFLCHTEPFCGHPESRTLVDGLEEIRTFLDSRPGEIVTLIFEAYVSADDTAAAFEEAGLLDPAAPEADFLYEHDGGPWPTLGELVERGEQVVVLTDTALAPADQARFPWYHHLWQSLAFETSFGVTPEEFEVSGFSCEDLRGEPENDLFILNHFLTRVIGHPTFAELVNHDPFFLARALECEAFYGRIPNFVTVDFYEIGDVLRVVDALNGL